MFLAKSHHAVITLIALLSFSLAAGEMKVHKLAEGTKPKLAFIINNSSDFWTPAQAGLKKFTAETGIPVDFKIPASGKPEEQKAIIEDLVSQGYNGIAVSVVQPKDQIIDLNNAAAKLNLICHDSDAPASNRLAYIGTNNIDAGAALGEALKKALPKGGKVAVFVGTFSADNATQRLRGIQKALKGSNLEIVLKKEDNTDKSKARSNVEDILNANPEIDVLLGLWSYNPPAIEAAAKQLGKTGKVTIAGFDDEEATLKGIENGTIAFTVVQKPFEFGYKSAKLLHELCTKGEAALPKDPNIDTGVDVIDATNVKAYRAKQAEMKK